MHDVLAVLSRATTLAGLLVVTLDAEAAALARGHGAIVRNDPLEQGTNAAVRQGPWSSCRNKGGRALSSCPDDVLFLTVAGNPRGRRHAAPRPLVLVPATRDGGTNLPGRHATAFDRPGLRDGKLRPPSRRRPGKGHRARPPAPEGLGHDVDTPADLMFLVERTCHAAARRRGADLAVDELRQLHIGKQFLGIRHGRIEREIEARLSGEIGNLSL